jgi:hypothetical protein
MPYTLVLVVVSKATNPNFDTNHDCYVLLLRPNAKSPHNESWYNSCLYYKLVWLLSHKQCLIPNILQNLQVDIWIFDHSFS